MGGSSSSLRASGRRNHRRLLPAGSSSSLRALRGRFVSSCSSSRFSLKLRRLALAGFAFGSGSGLVGAGFGAVAGRSRLPLEVNAVVPSNRCSWPSSKLKSRSTVRSRNSGRGRPRRHSRGSPPGNPRARSRSGRRGRCGRPAAEHGGLDQQATEVQPRRSPPESLLTGWCCAGGKGARAAGTHSRWSHQFRRCSRPP